MDSNTSLFCVIGNPVAHSLSPLIHNLAFKVTKFNGAYVAFKVEDIKTSIEGIRALGIKGASITIPHKLEVMNSLDYIDKTAEDIGAVNTIINENGVLKGLNTDCDGAIKALKIKTEIKDKKILIFGSGGSARAIGYGINKSSGDLTITNRTTQKGVDLANFLSCEFTGLDKINVSDFDILINTTSLGMHPNVDSSPIDLNSLHSKQVVMDIVYNPLKTKLLKDAEKKGCITVNGIEMFVNQAVLQFEAWTGLKGPYIEMKNAVLEELTKR
ncbi:MAG: shikimate dehydrogenase [Desulfobacterales bacterium]|nr:shikimate dehydrogenase [Desulfobacterales bacterium]MCP4160135.1 shikimate dehydrogenase [Deltaproteobacteria bacterium]